MSIELLCPSRGRPQAAAELLLSFDSTRTTDDVELTFCVDDDDPTLPLYPRSVVAGPPTGDPTGPLNRQALVSKASIVGFIGDDSRFETEGWDAKVIRALTEAGGGFCWAQDGHQKPWPSTVFVSSWIVQSLGWLALPTLKRGFFDVCWIKLAEATGRAVTLPGVMVRHDNSGQGVSPVVIDQDERAFMAWLQGPFRADAARIRAYPRGLQALGRHL